MISLFWPKPFGGNVREIDETDVGQGVFARIMEVCGNPHLRLPPVIHVAGTNGKGSVCAMLTSILKEAGYTAHRYTSPHLVNVNECIVVSGYNVSDDVLSRYTDYVRVKCEENGIVPNYFEGLTAIAFMAFADHPADVTIIETGIGGLLDPTNIVHDPVATMITTISNDHVKCLGKTLPEIAKHKAGIIKRGVIYNSVCVIGPQYDEVMDVLFDAVDEAGCSHDDVLVHDSDFSIGYGEIARVDGIVYQTFKFLSRRYGDMTLPMPNLPGYHQLFNAAMVIAVLLRLQENGLLRNIDEVSLSRGLRNIDWPGRLQQYNLQRITGSCPVLAHENISVRDIKCYLDGAHNTAGAYALSKWIIHQAPKSVYIILGMTEGRDVKEFIEQFRSLEKVLYICSVEMLSEVSGYPAKHLADIVFTSGFDGAAFEDIDSAVEFVYATAKEQSLVIVTGSLFLVADFLKR